MNNLGTNLQEQIHKLTDELNRTIKLAKIFEDFIDSSYDPIFITDKNGYGFKMNKAYTRVTGATKEQLIGKHMNDLKEQGIISDSISMHVLEKKERLTMVQKVNGKELLVTGNPIFDENGEILYVVTNLRDISSLNQLKIELKQTKALADQYLQELEFYQKKEHIISHQGIIANSDKMLKVIDLVQKIAPVHSTVLLLGESGVGKEIIANLIQKLSSRANQPFIKVNCAAIPKDLLESELFGYEKGAFTGADIRGRAGLFEQADKGTIFLDEIGEMPLHLQVKLLRVIQELEVRRIGGGQPKKIDIRIISATNKDLESMVVRGEFRQDLYYRLNVVPIKIPSLRERKEDIPLLAFYFLKKLNQKYNMNKQLSDAAITQMKTYSWPGNIREMQNLIERLVVTVESEMIDTRHFSFNHQYLSQSLTTEKTLKDVVQDLERTMIMEAMVQYRSTRKAAKALGISQSTLVKKMQRLGFQQTDYVLHQ
ncbi:sigma-54 interaction domain-containing protein [Neobacillus sp. SAB-20_R2A]|uniref:sigma-54 interaction domain-containing protein n=1 Tax=Neobacillus sp. SAB-20_R2A TaxID=3120519 RepID=UPI003C6E94A8